MTWNNEWSSFRSSPSSIHHHPAPFLAAVQVVITTLVHFCISWQLLSAFSRSLIMINGIRIKICKLWNDRQNIPLFVGRRCTVPEYGTNPKKNISNVLFHKNDTKSNKQIKQRSCKHLEFTRFDRGLLLYKKQSARINVSNMRTNQTNCTFLPLSCHQLINWHW